MPDYSFKRRVLKQQGREILIPPPPSLQDLAKELPVVLYQYHNRVNPPELQDELDNNFAGLFNKILVDANYTAYRPTIKKLEKEILGTIKHHKNYFNSMRPHELAELLDLEFDYDVLKSAQTPSYPSGHTTQAYYIAIKLSQIFPELKQQLFDLAEAVAESRIDRGVHFLSDNFAGMLLAKILANKPKL